MFINCPHCGALIATDPATDLPPPRCPRCAGNLHASQQPSTAPAEPASATGDAAEAVAAPTAALAEAIAAAAAPAAGDMATATAADAGHDIASGSDGVVADTRSGSDIPDRSIPAQTGVATDSTVPATPDRTAATTASDRGVGIAEATQDRSSKADTAGRTPDAVAERAPAVPEAREPPPSVPAADAPTPARRDKPAPSFARIRAPAAAANARRRWTLPSLIAGLSLLLVLQWILADRARLAADAGWRPFVAQVCATLRCELPPWREPSAFALLERDVRPHPDVPGALRVTATFRNDARWPQPWPQVMLTLSDVDGHAVGARVFDAGEYLGAAPTQKELSSGQTATIRMDVLEPAPRVVAFAFDFR